MDLSKRDTYFLTTSEDELIDDFVKSVKTLDELKEKLKDFVSKLLITKGAIY